MRYSFAFACFVSAVFAGGNADSSSPEEDCLNLPTPPMPYPPPYLSNGSKGPAQTPPANAPPANTPPANAPPANTPPANAPAANNPPAATTPVITWTTYSTDYITTWCSEPTTLRIGTSTYIVTEPTTLTITDCGCTITRPVPVQPNTPTPVPATPATPTPYVASQSTSTTMTTSPVQYTPPPGNATVPLTTPTGPAAFTGAANRLAGAGLAAVLGFAVVVL